MVNVHVILEIWYLLDSAWTCFVHTNERYYVYHTN